MGHGAMRICLRCNRERRHQARGLCSACHSILTDRGRLDEYAPTKTDTQGRVLPLYRAGLGAAEISRELGISRNAAWCTIRAIRQKEAAVTGYRYESPNGLNPWAKLDFPAPAVEPECKGEAYLFVDWLGDKSPMRGGHPETWAQPFLAAALAVCNRCPLQQWCIEAAEPHRSKVTIIAGGALWVKGRRVWTVADQERLEARQAQEAAA